ncbi:MAG: YpmA family protein [Peptococcaceae bacterium]|nr:YpmA family protein [Peptococcaceae bacterium]
MITMDKQTTKSNIPVQDKLKEKPNNLELIASQRFREDPQLYKIVDFLNRTLKSHHLLFGLTKSEEGMSITIYEVE